METIKNPFKFNFPKKYQLYIKRVFNKLEIYVLIAGLAGYILKTTGSEIGETLIILSLSILIILYYFIAYTLPEEKKGKWNEFVYKLTCWSWSICLAGIVFKIQHYPGGEIMSRVGLLSLLMALPAMLFINNKTKEAPVFNNKMIIRTAVILGVGILVYMAPAGLI